MDQALSDDDPMSPGQASGDTAMTEVSTQSYLSDVDDRPASEYFTESDSNRPSVVKDLISMWDGLVDEGRWTSGELYYHDGSLAEGRIVISRLTYNKDGLDRYGRARVEHWSIWHLEMHRRHRMELRRIVSVSGFMIEEDRVIRQSIRDQEIAAVSAAET